MPPLEEEEMNPELNPWLRDAHMRNSTQLTAGIADHIYEYTSLMNLRDGIADHIFDDDYDPFMNLRGNPGMRTHGFLQNLYNDAGRDATGYHGFLQNLR